MASIYYPTSASIYTRLVDGNSLLTELVIGISPNTIIFLTGSLPTSASAVNSASYAMSSSSSSYSITSSFALRSVTDILAVQVFT